MIENDEEIVLDNASNVFVGPEGYFKIIIDEFDSNVVKAWHIEDSKGYRTFNLADRAKGKNIDLLVNARCRTVWHFIGRFAPALVTEQYSQINSLKAAK
jgi:hypothetical protein